MKKQFTFKYMNSERGFVGYNTQLCLEVFLVFELPGNTKSVTLQVQTVKPKGPHMRIESIPCGLRWYKPGSDAAHLFWPSTEMLLTRSFGNKKQMYVRCIRSTQS